MKTIIKREWLDHVQSLQFIVLLIFSIVLFSASGIIFGQKMQQLNISYGQSAAGFNRPSSRWATIGQRPNPSLYLAEGGDLDRPSVFMLQAKENFSAFPPRPRDFKLPDVPKLDWSFIIKIVFSLYVILLGYAAVCGEKEEGTLRLVLSNSVGRVRFLAAKYIAILGVALVPLLAGCLVSSVILAIVLPQSLASDSLARALAMVLLGSVYISLFAFLSLLVSSLIPRSSLALLALLAGWIVFIVLIPDTSGILAQRLAKVPSDYQAFKNQGPFVQKEVWDKIHGIQARIDKGELKTEEEVRRASDQAFEEGQEKMRFFEKNFEDSMKQRALLARTLSRLSPMALFQYAAENVAQTGLRREESFRKDIRAYSRIFDDYVLKKTGKLVGGSNWSFSSSVKLNGKSIELHSPRPEDYRGDMSDFPKFVERPFRFSDGIASALGDIAGLLVWNILLAGLAFSAFLRLDVR